MDRAKLKEVIDTAIKSTSFIAHQANKSKNLISKSIAKDTYPRILNNLFSLKKNKVIKASDSEIIRCAKKQSNYYGHKAENHILNKVIKSTQDTVLDVIDEFEEVI